MPGGSGPDSESSATDGRVAHDLNAPGARVAADDEAGLPARLAPERPEPGAPKGGGGLAA